MPKDLTIPLIKEGEIYLDEDGELLHYDLESILRLARNVPHFFARRKEPSGPMILYGRAKITGDGYAIPE